MEIKRSINNKSFLFCIATVTLAFVLGYILLISIDKAETVTLRQLLFSVYTVFTQFGMMMFPIIIIYSINVDYKEKNILFYRVMGIDAKKYFFSKLGVIFLWFSTSIILVNTIVCIIYNDFSLLGVICIYFENVIIYIILITSVLAFCFKNMLVSFCINLFIWISQIVVFTVFPNLNYVAYFDASNVLYKNLDIYLQTSNAQYISIGQSCLYNLGLFIMALGLVNIFSNRWIKNGV